MIAKHQISHKASALISYVLRTNRNANLAQKTNPEIILSNIISGSQKPQSIVKTINAYNALRRSGKTDKVHHLIFSHPRKDMPRVDDVGEEQIIERVLLQLQKKGIDLYSVPFCVVRHEDKENVIDYHLVAASTNQQGKAINDSYIGSRAMKICNDISRELGLSLNNNKRERNEKKKRASLISNMDFSIDEVLQVVDKPREELNIERPDIVASSVKQTKAEKEEEARRLEEEKRQEELRQRRAREAQERMQNDIRRKNGTRFKM